MSDTPMTDKTALQGFVAASFARHLEQKLNEANALIERLDAWRQYALDVEEYTEVKLGVYLDRREWDKVKETKPKEANP